MKKVDLKKNGGNNNHRSLSDYERYSLQQEINETMCDDIGF